MHLGICLSARPSVMQSFRLYVRLGLVTLDLVLSLYLPSYGYNITFHHAQRLQRVFAVVMTAAVSLSGS